MVSMNVGADCETEKEGEAGAKPHHKQCLHCMTHNFTRSHDLQRSVCVSSEAEAMTTEPYYNYIIYTYSVL